MAAVPSALPVALKAGQSDVFTLSLCAVPHLCKSTGRVYGP